jgi:hypothetical protein
MEHHRFASIRPVVGCLEVLLEIEVTAAILVEESPSANGIQSPLKHH